MERKVEFKATYYRRSSREGYDGKVPSERDVLALNPGRKELICTNRHWPDLFPGTFNVHMDDSLYEDINKIVPVINEPPVKYPAGYEHIAEKRGGYLYWKCKAYANGRKMKCLFRAAKKRIDGVGELVAKESICDKLMIKDEKQEVRLKIYGDAKLIQEGAGTGEIFLKRDNGQLASVQGMYKNGHAFLIASGPSFNDLNKEPLKFCYTACVNNSPKACMPYFRPRMWTCVDGADKFLYTIWADPNIMKIVPDSHVGKPLWNSDLNEPFGKYTVSDMPNVLYYPRNNKFNSETFLTEPTFNWGNSEKIKDANGVGGKRSVFLPAIKLLYVLGFRHIYLLGVDFNMESGAQNYSFAQDRKESSVKGNNATYKQLQYRFELLRPVFEKAGLQVYNCNRESHLTAFDHMPYNEALDRALWWTDKRGEWMNGWLENTANLYETKWFVCPKCGRNQRVSKEDVKTRKVSCECGRRIRRRDRRKYCKTKYEKTSKAIKADNVNGKL